jgi:prevent-host-death family protein
MRAETGVWTNLYIQRSALPRDGSSGISRQGLLSIKRFPLSLFQWLEPVPGDKSLGCISADLTYSTFDAKARLSEILDKFSEGQEVVITRDGKAVAKVVPIPQITKRELGFGFSEVGFLPGSDQSLIAEDLLVE